MKEEQDEVMINREHHNNINVLTARRKLLLVLQLVQEDGQVTEMSKDLLEGVAGCEEEYKMEEFRFK